MNAKIILGVAATIIAASSCNTKAAQPLNNYTLTVNVSTDDDGETMYITDYDNGAKIDSAIVEDGMAVFKGHIDEAVYVRLLMDGRRNGDLILEPVEITFTPSKRELKSEGALNKRLEELSDKIQSLSESLNNIPSGQNADSVRQAVYAQYEILLDDALAQNADNALGYNLLLSKVQGMDLNELNETMTSYPKFKDSKRIESYRNMLKVKEETSVGKPYKDFTITQEDGTSQKLSDYVGNGHYTLVDFWASWCNPCIRETKVIKELYNKYQGKGLEVLGVAVWDKKEDTLRGIETHQLPWQQILNAQTIPTDLYGIQGIPCIILIDPNGKIVSRDKQDQELIDDVEAAMAQFKAHSNSDSTND